MLMKRLLLLTLCAAGFSAAAEAQINAFGLSVTFDGDHILVGQPAPSGEPGSVFFFAREGEDENWKVVGAPLQASDGEPGDFFGFSVAVHGDHLYVGAPSAAPGQGAVYVFERVAADTSWNEIAKLEAGENDHIGANLAIADGLVVTGSLAGSETVVAFMETEAGWTSHQSISPSSVQDSDRFGTVVATDGHHLYVGASGLNGGDGGVFVFRHEGGGWVESHLVEAPVAGAAFGGGRIHLADDGHILIGAPGLILNVQATSLPPPGRLVWGQMQEDNLHVHQILQASETAFDMFGSSYQWSDSRLLVGAGFTDQGTGRVYTYDLDASSNQWVSADTLAGLATEQLFGMFLAAQGDHAVISAPGSEFGDGSVSVYARDAETGEWAREETLSSEEKIELLASGAVDCEEGLAGQFSCSNVNLLAFMPISAYGGGEGSFTNDVWGWTHPETGREIALVGRNDGLALVDITDASSPMFLGDLPLTEGARPSTWRDMKVYNNHVFIVADGAGLHGMQVFDLMQLSGDFEQPATFEATALYTGIASAHNIVINEATGFAYTVGSSGGGETCGGGLHMINIQDPTNPEFAGCFSDTATGRAGTGYSHDAQCVIYHGPDSDYTDREICFNSNETALSISDVTDKENTVALSNASYPNAAYAHQGWLTDDHAYFYMNDELDELGGDIVGTRTLIWDVTDLEDPQLLKEHMSENLASDHNLYIKGNLMYQSNYQSGLRIFDISDVANPVEVGFFDTYPIGTDAPGFDGSWSNYPYFESGVVIVTSMNEGLFIVRRQELDM